MRLYPFTVRSCRVFAMARHVPQSPASKVMKRFALIPVFTLVVSVSAQAPAKPLIQGSEPAARMEAERARSAADQRQQKMLQDADKLLELAQHLKVSVDRTNKNTLSVDVVREAERIEKLARQVKDNMRQ